MNWTDFTVVAVIHLLAVASPGPDFAIVVRHSLHYGRSAALITSIGIGVGILVHVLYSIVGLSVVIATTPWLFDVIRFLAAAYLLYLAYQSLRSGPSNQTVNTSQKDGKLASISAKKAFTIGFVTNGINPKATLFFLSLFTLVIEPGTSVAVKVIYGTYLSLATAAWFCMLSFLLNHPKVMVWLQTYSHWVDRSMGVLLIIVAGNLVLFSSVS